MPAHCGSASPYFGLLVGAGIGLSTIVPCQALATSWFTKYRARAVATVLTAGGTVGVLVTWFDRVMVQEYSWRTGWQIIAVLSLALAVLAAATVRNRPSDLGQKPDGMLPEATDHRSADATVTAASSDAWTLSSALRTPQFAVLCLCTVAFAIPWSVTTAHGRLHLEDLGLSTDVAAQILSVMILVSIAGRITGAAGDFLVPEKVLGFALLVEAAGMFGLLLATPRQWRTSRQSWSRWDSARPTSPRRWWSQNSLGESLLPRPSVPST
ncbi:MAG: hypothetical protein CM1200mP2_49460 [Planctomycetaceae bacterium]|nr:MAG: hypothetical protein CM1200mP2_49460 [Planctomycetaceae bacterium]